MSGPTRNVEMESGNSHAHRTPRLSRVMEDIRSATPVQLDHPTRVRSGGGRFVKNEVRGAPLQHLKRRSDGRWERAEKRKPPPSGFSQLDEKALEEQI